MGGINLKEFDLSDENFIVNPFRMETGGHILGMDELNELHEHFQKGNITAEQYIEVHSLILKANPELSIFNAWTPLPGPQLLAYLSKADELYYGGSAGGGKGFNTVEHLITPFGEKQVQDIKRGDLLSNPDGSASRVIGVYPQPKQMLYEVTFIDGAKTQVTADHIWLYTLSSRISKREKRLGLDQKDRGKFGLTLDLMDLLERAERNVRPNYPLIPLTEPVQFTMPSRVNPRKIPPYVLGVLLADGCISHFQVCYNKPDVELLEEVKKVSRKHWHSNAYNTHSLKDDDKREYQNHLKTIGLLFSKAETKFVPKVYKYAPIQDRFELLQGLFDGDGYADERGHIEYTSVSKELAHDVQWIARSLGAKATITTKQGQYRDENGNVVICQLAYRVYIQSPDNSRFFRLSRKKNRCSGKEYNGGASLLKRRLEKIEEVGEREAICVKVDNPNGLVISGDFVVSHNSDLLIGLALTGHHKSIIFRREYPQLTDIISRSYQIFEKLPGKIIFNQHSKVWRGLPDKKTIELGAVEHSKDKNKYKGRPHDAKLFDELPDFSEDLYLFLSGWLRTARENQRTRIVGAGNPPTESEGFWVVKRWGPWLDPTHPNPAKPGELRWFIRVDDEDREVEDDSPIKYKDEVLYPKSRTFIPARLDDNPYLSSTNEYRSTLQNLPEPLRSQLLYGDFTLGLTDDPWQVIKTEWVQAANNRWRKINEQVKAYLRGDIEELPRFSSLSPVDVFGVDVARGGQGKTVYTPRSGNYIHSLKKVNGKDTPDGQSVYTHHSINYPKMKNSLTIIDVIGVGASAYDKYVENYIMVTGFNGSNKSKAKDHSGMLKMGNLRAEAYWKFRELLDPTITDEEFLLALPPDSELTADLTAPHWKSTPQGILIEDKKEIQKRIGRSPDCGDSAVYSVFGELETYVGDDEDMAAVGGSRGDQGNYDDIGGFY